jgi:hypothetical protein
MNLPVIFFIAALALFAALTRDASSANIIGLAMVYTLQLMGITPYSLKLFSEVEQCMTSAERVLVFNLFPATNCQ